MTKATRNSFVRLGMPASALLTIGVCIMLSSFVPGRSVAGNTALSCRVEADRGVLPARGTEKVIVKVTVKGRKTSKAGNRPPVNLCIVLDRSGSMQGAKIAKAKQAAVEAVRRLGPEDVFSLVIYGHEARVVVPARHVRDVEEIESRIRSVEAGGSTALFAGVTRGANEIRRHLEGNYVHRIILLSDGLANVGPRTPEELGRLGASLVKEGISVTTVGVGTGYNEDLMTRLSQKSDGNAYFAEFGTDLPRIISEELGDVLTVVAKNVRIIVDFSANVRPLGIIGRDGRIKGQRAELTLNQVYGGQEKYALLEAEVQEPKAGDHRELAVARVTFDSPLTGSREAASARSTIRFSDDETDVRRSANLAVQKAYEILLNAVAQENAIRLADKGRAKEALAELKRSVRRLEEVGNKLNSPEIVQRANTVKRQVQRLESEGMTSRNRKDLRTDSYQQQNQQMRR